MMENRSHAQKSSLREASIAGGGVGTVVAGCIDLLPDGTIKKILILFVPALTAITSGLWIFFKWSYFDPLVFQKRTQQHEAAVILMEKLVSDAKANLQEAIRENSSKAVVADLRKTVEELQRRQNHKILELSNLVLGIDK